MDSSLKHNDNNNNTYPSSPEFHNNSNMMKDETDSDTSSLGPGSHSKNYDPSPFTGNSSPQEQPQPITQDPSQQPQKFNEKNQPNPENDEDEGVPLESLDWDSPDDPGNPKNWSLTRRWVVTMTAATMCLSVTCGSSLYVAGTFGLMREFHASQTLVLSGLTFYLIGLSLGPILGAPLSELFGRKIVYIVTMPISMLFVMGVGLSHNIQSVLVLRFLAGFVSSPVMAIAGGTISDLWDTDMFGLAMSAFCVAPFAGPVLGPIMGGFAVQNKNWRWTMWISLMLSGAILPFLLWMPETYKSAIMRSRAKARGIKIAKPKVSLGGFLKIIFVLTVARPLEMILYREPIVIVLSIYTAFVVSILFGFFEAYPVIYSGVYHFHGGVSSLPFIGIGLGLALGVGVFVVIDRTIFYPIQPDGTRVPKDENGNPVFPPAETRLLPAKIGAVGLPIALFWQAWTARASVHWMAPIAAGVPFGMSLLLIFFTILLYFTLSYPTIILASALAANNLARYLMASVFPLFTVQMYEKMGIDWASSFFAFVALAMLPIPWIFERYGAQLRARSYFNKMIAAEEEKKRQDALTLEELEDDNLSLSLARSLSRHVSVV